MFAKKLILAGASLLVLAACGKKDAENADAKLPENLDDVPAIEDAMAEVEETGKQMREEARAASKKFLEENAAREGVTVAESGLQLRTIAEGDGDLPGEDDFARFHFKAMTIDGDVVNNSRDMGDPVTVPVNEVIDGWQEALLGLREGGRAEVVLPPALLLAEGQTMDDAGAPDQAMVFDFEMIEVIPAGDTARLQELQAEAQQKAMDKLKQIQAANLAEAKNFLSENKAKDGIKETGSGLQYKVLTSGDGSQSPEATDMVEVHYRGTLMDGTEFDSSYKRGETITFPLNGVIKGWTEGLQLMKEGDKFRFFIPPEIAYGDMGRPPVIPPNSLLIFDVELVDVNPEPEAPTAEETPQ